MVVDIITEKRDQYLLMTSVGDISDLDQWKSLSMKYFEVIAAHQSQYTISDIRKLSMPHGLFSMMELVDHVSEEIPIEVRSLYVAVVLLPEYETLGRFWETASANRGFRNSRVFFDFDEAEAWLISNIPS